jgi:hypothetical protein
LNVPVLPAEPPCSTQSLQAGERLAGTAVTSVGAWLLIECRDRWAPRVHDTEALPPGLRRALEALDGTLPIVRPMLIRRPQTDPEAPHRVILVQTGPGGSAVGFERPDLAALDGMDLVGMCQGETPPPSDATALARPVWLVCTHGRRDRCCARLGVPVWQALTDLGTEDVWQCSHLGGHRFAATAVHLPSGVSYGRLQPGDVRPMVDAHAAGTLYRLDRMRGRTTLGRPAQAAEIVLRGETGEMGIDAYTHQGTTPREGSGWTVRFTAAEGEIHTVHLAEERTGPEVQPSCAKTKMAPVMNLQCLSE